ncbi:hypothetical protein [Kitasatospora sp. MBT63]|uniref:hypothetical protein n=1 Tax=Kitasatospora sp. MBT63 TaxID=1444768 RepID=UPI0011EA6592|nr:hypothetical protein [Kitasatospora sp. MBT63]
MESAEWIKIRETLTQWRWLGDDPASIADRKRIGELPGNFKDVVRKYTDHTFLIRYYCAFLNSRGNPEYAAIARELTPDRINGFHAAKGWRQPEVKASYSLFRREVSRLRSSFDRHPEQIEQLTDAYFKNVTKGHGSGKHGVVVSERLAIADKFKPILPGLLAITDLMDQMANTNALQGSDYIREKNDFINPYGMIEKQFDELARRTGDLRRAANDPAATEDDVAAAISAHDLALKGLQGAVGKISSDYRESLIDLARTVHADNLSDTNPGLADKLTLIASINSTIQTALGPLTALFPPLAIIFGIMSAGTAGHKYYATKQDARRQVGRGNIDKISEYAARETEGKLSGRLGAASTALTVGDYARTGASGFLTLMTAMGSHTPGLGHAAHVAGHLANAYGPAGTGLDQVDELAETALDSVAGETARATTRRTVQRDFRMFLSNMTEHISAAHGADGHQSGVEVLLSQYPQEEFYFDAVFGDIELICTVTKDALRTGKRGDSEANTALVTAWCTVKIWPTKGPRAKDPTDITYLLGWDNRRELTFMISAEGLAVSLVHPLTTALFVPEINDGIPGFIFLDRDVESQPLSDVHPYFRFIKEVRHGDGTLQTYTTDYHLYETEGTHPMDMESIERWVEYLNAHLYG